MNDRWLKPDGTRWNSPECIRMARRFRGHVLTPSNPRGRIGRLPCVFYQRKSRGKLLSPDCHGEPADFHHINYGEPFVGVWLCRICHRRVDHRGLRLTRRMICDYTSLIEPIAKPNLRAEHRKFTPKPQPKRPRREKVKTPDLPDPRRQVEDEVPF